MTPTRMTCVGERSRVRPRSGVHVMNYIDRYGLEVAWWLDSNACHSVWAVSWSHA